MTAVGRPVGKVPVTYRVDVRAAMELLDYVELVGLSDMFARWAIWDEGLKPESRTRLIQLSSDYEQIAAFAGEGWRAERTESPPPLIVFAAVREAQARNLYGRR